MNERDLNNLNYIFSLTADELNVWFGMLTPDDREYAEGLIKKHNSMLTVTYMELTDEVKDISDAKAVIDRIKRVR